MQLKASKREPLGKRTRRLHREGKLAAVVYGHSAEATPLVLDRLEFQKVFVKSGGTHLVDLVVDGDRTEKVLVREIQTHPRRLGPIHVDFYQVSLEEKIRVEVPVHLTGALAPGGYRRGRFPVTDRAADEILSLPLFPGITKAQQERVAEVLTAAVVRHG